MIRSQFRPITYYLCLLFGAHGNLGNAQVIVSPSTFSTAGGRAGSNTFSVIGAVEYPLQSGQSGNGRYSLFGGFFFELNSPPAISNSISSQVWTLGASPFTRDLAAPPPVFYDPDGDTLKFRANSSKTTVAIASTLGNVLSIVPVTAGETTITVTASDDKDDSTSTQFSFNVVQYASSYTLRDTIFFPSYSTPLEYASSDYRLIGLPGNSKRPVNEFLAGTNGVDWQVFWDNGQSSNFFVEFNGSTNFAFTLGRAFWIINKGPLIINTTVPTEPLNVQQEVKIPLHNGWNIITNPFDSAILWKNIQQANGGFNQPVYSYQVDGAGFVSSSSFKPYVGYYFFKPMGIDFLTIPYRLIYSTPGDAEGREGILWSVRIGLSTDTFSDSAASFGIASESSNGLDPLDLRKPRALAGASEIAFHRPQWDADYSSFISDFRPLFEDDETWEFEVHATRLQKTRMTFSGVGRIPSRFAVFLIDEDNIKSVDLRQDSSYLFIPVNKRQRFQAVVGLKDKVKEKLAALALPQKFSLGPNYPNPFNPITIIRVELPIASSISLKVYNVRGEEIITIYEGNLAGGRHWFTWNGTKESKEVVASGLYFYRLKAEGGIILTGKMILLR